MTIYSNLFLTEAQHADLRHAISKSELTISDQGKLGSALIGLQIPDTEETDDVVIKRTGSIVSVNGVDITITSPVTALTVKLLSEGKPVIRKSCVTGTYSVYEANELVD